MLSTQKSSCIKSTILMLFVMAAAACTAPKPLEYRAIKSFSLQQSGLSKTVLSLDLLAYNPNTYRLKLKNMKADVFINQRLVGQAYVSEKITVPAHDTGHLSIQISADPVEIMPGAIQYMLGNEVMVKIKGELRAGRHGIYLKIPLQYEQAQHK